MPELARRILTRCLALAAGSRESIDTTLITAILSESSGFATSATPTSIPTSGIGDGFGQGNRPSSHSRSAYVAKASRAERNAGLDGFAERVRPITQGHGMGPVNTSKGDGTGLRENRPTANHHPTVKPIALMRWLCRLVTPPGGRILDPFAGSGTTGCAAVLEDFDFIGIEREAEYVDIARARIDHWARQPKQLDLIG